MKRKPATKAELAHLAAVKRLPCIACELMGCAPQCGATEAHHALSGGRRRGHEYTVSLGTWHHRGVLLRGWTKDEMTAWYGPSLANGSKPFHAAFGDNEFLLAETVKLLKQQSVDCVNAIRIDRGIAIPEGRTTPWPFHAMVKGESFLVPEKRLSALKSAVTTWHKKHHGDKFIVRKVDGGFRCWKVT